MTPLEACDYAAKILLKAGFVFSHCAMNTTSCYYSFPGRSGLLRVSTHRGSKRKDRPGRMYVAALTFSHRAVRHNGQLLLSGQALDAEIERGIGRFMVNSWTAEKSRAAP